MDYSVYKDSYDTNIIEEWKEGIRDLDLESLREQLFGFTFTDDYCKGHIEDGFSMDYWKDNKVDDEQMCVCELLDFDEIPDSADMYEVDTPQEHLIMKVLDSTGDGKTPETAISVIDVGQEYEYLARKFPFSCLIVYEQELTDGIDCIRFKENVYDIDCVYFDMRRRFEVGYPNHNKLLSNM